ncbi:hypothetical protein AAKU55_000331 [Oxalobacteraceae bacterium GrIS 1.11]
MKLTSILLTTIIAGVGLIGHAAQAAPSNHGAAAFVLADDGFEAYFGNHFSSGALQNTFADKYFFELNGNFDASASLTSTYLNSIVVKDLLITGFSLNKFDPLTKTTLLTMTGVNQTNTAAHAPDSWSLNGAGLSSGTYFLEVDGKVIGNGGGTYGGDLTVSAVPEPETYGMLLAGLGCLAWMARRKAKSAV